MDVFVDDDGLVSERDVAVVVVVVVVLPVVDASATALLLSLLS